VIDNSDLMDGHTAGLSIPVQGAGDPATLFNTYGNITLQAGNIGNSQAEQSWIFDASGNLTIPGNISAPNGTEITTPQGSAQSIDIYTDWNGNGTSGGVDVWLKHDEAIYLKTDDNNYIWTFDKTGNLNVPGDITGANVISANYFSGDGSNLSNISGSNITDAPEPAFNIRSANFAAAQGSRYGVDTTGGAVVATLPASPTTGGAVYFADAGGAFATNNLIIDPNGGTIMGSSGNMTISTNNQSFGLFYNGTTWRTYNI